MAGGASGTVPIYNVGIRGLKDLNDALYRMSPEIRLQWGRDARKIMRSTLLPPVRRRAPRGRTGRLRKGIKAMGSGMSPFVRVSAVSDPSGAYPSGVEYAHMVAYGHDVVLPGARSRTRRKPVRHPDARDVKPNRFIRDGISEGLPEFNAQFIDLVEDYAKQAGFRLKGM